MKKKRIIVIIILVLMTIGGIGIVGKNAFIVDSHTENKNSSSWKEVKIKNNVTFARCTDMKEFDLKETIKEADYVFSGKIINAKEYEVEWTDDNGEKWGPFPSSIIEVKIKHEYYGKSPVKDDVIKIYYPYSLSTVFEGCFIIKNKEEYVFVSQTLDEKFVEKRKKIAPDDKFQQEKYADVYISHPCYDIMAIDGDTVLMHNDYFSWDQNTMKKIKKNKSIKRNTMSSPKLIETGWFIALDKKDFNKAFLKLFKNVKELPNAAELQKIK